MVEVIGKGREWSLIMFRLISQSVFEKLKK